MKQEPPIADEELPRHVQAKETGKFLDATVLLPFNIALAWTMAFTSPAKKDTGLKGF